MRNYAVRKALSSLLSSLRLRMEVITSAAAYLQFNKPDALARLILDLELPSMSGLELQQDLAGEHAPQLSSSLDMETYRRGVAP